MNAFQQYFYDLAQTHPKWNFIYLYDPTQTDRVIEGLWMTIQLSVVCVILSVIIGVIGAWAQGAHSKYLRLAMQGYIQFFRNTPPLVQLMFFYFALGQFTPTYSPDGWLEVPIISNVGWPLFRFRFLPARSTLKFSAPGSRQYPIPPRKRPKRSA